MEGMQSAPSRSLSALLEPEPALAAHAGGRRGAGVQPRAGGPGGRAGDAARAGARVSVRRAPGRGRQAPRPARALPVRAGVYCSRIAPGSAAPGSAPVFASAGSPRHAAWMRRQAPYRRACAPPCESLSSLAIPASGNCTRSSIGPRLAGHLCVSATTGRERASAPRKNGRSGRWLRSAVGAVREGGGEARRGAQGVRGGDAAAGGPLRRGAGPRRGRPAAHAGPGRQGGGRGPRGHRLQDLPARARRPPPRLQPVPCSNSLLPSAMPERSAGASTRVPRAGRALVLQRTVQKLQGECRVRARDTQGLTCLASPCTAFAQVGCRTRDLPRGSRIGLVGLLDFVAQHAGTVAQHRRHRAHSSVKYQPAVAPPSARRRRGGGGRRLRNRACDPFASPCARRRLLREEFTSGRLDAAPSKAAVLGELCERLGFDAEAAAGLHRQLYRERLEALLAEDKRIGGTRPGLGLGCPMLAPRRLGQSGSARSAAAMRSGAMQVVRMQSPVGLYAHPLQRPPCTIMLGMQQAAEHSTSSRVVECRQVACGACACLRLAVPGRRAGTAGSQHGRQARAPGLRRRQGRRGAGPAAAAAVHQARRRAPGPPRHLRPHLPAGAPPARRARARKRRLCRYARAGLCEGRRTGRATSAGAHA